MCFCRPFVREMLAHMDTYLNEQHDGEMYRKVRVATHLPRLSQLRCSIPWYFGSSTLLRVASDSRYGNEVHQASIYAKHFTRLLPYSLWRKGGYLWYC
jgi:hypothetical protein